MAIHDFSTLRLGLCCQFAKEPIRFRTTTATSLQRMGVPERLQKLSDLCLSNARALRNAVQYCADQAIGSFRIASTILPVKTHSEVGYQLEELPAADEIIAQFRQSGETAKKHDVRLVFHPDQFVVLNSPRPEVVVNAVKDLTYHAELCDWVGADVINIHGGGAYGDKPAALALLERNLESLPDNVRRRLTLENDDKVYTPADLLPICRRTGIPLVYDVHHHRCLRDDLTTSAATDRARATWNREPLFHISSPLAGWQGPQPHRHHDYIDVRDVPDCWRSTALTVEVEAKAKELAVLKLRDELRSANPRSRKLARVDDPRKIVSQRPR
ncbi:MAG: UV DNA damage repair endonuclease UvsE [Pirellula sp.]|nr:UV DNA damage repair endonuclease UvsE [Pirellula sp.]